MRDPSYTNWTTEKHPTKAKNKEKPPQTQTLEAQTSLQLSCNTFRGTPLKAAEQEAQRAE